MKLLDRVLGFTKESWELTKKISWPKQETLWELTVVVLLIAGVVASFLMGVDIVFTKFIAWLTLP